MEKVLAMIIACIVRRIFW